MGSSETSSRHTSLDPEAMRESLNLIRQSIGRYFRLEVYGGENLPGGRAMIVGCHSGVIPYDAACTLVAIEQETGRLALALGDHLWSRVGLVGEFLARRGMFDGTRAELIERLNEDNLVLVMPGGSDDMTRPIWRDRYRVLPHKGYAPAKGGYIKTALETASPIVPLAIVGAEEAHVFLWNAKCVADLFGAPFFPIVLFPFPLPVKIYVRFGEPIYLDEGPAAAHDQKVVDRLNRRVREELQALIDDTVQRRSGVIWSSYDAGLARPKPV